MSEFILENNKYSVKQFNGQCITTLLSSNDNRNLCKEKLNADKKEIFASNIPKTASFIELLKFFSSIGPVLEFRLMKTFAGDNRGYAYIVYQLEEDYKAAFNYLDGAEIYKRPITLRPSDDRKILMIGSRNPYEDFNEVLKAVKAMRIIPETYEINNYHNGNRLLLKFCSHLSAVASRHLLTATICSTYSSLWVSWED